MESLPLDARTWAEIDLGALLHNFQLAQKTGKKVMCVVKANAYGHGALRCALFLEKHGADAFAVACLSEALELRAGGVAKPILILGYTAPAHAAVLIGHDIIQTCVDEAHAAALSEAAQKAGGKLKVHIKIDTGMSRTGLLAQGEENALEAAKAAARICKLPGLAVKGMFTHFSVADTPAEDEYTAWQLSNYNTVLQYLTEKGLRPETCHTSNSACIMDHPETQIDMVREGIILYGLYPDSAPNPNGPLKPVLTLKSRVAQVRRLPAGTSVSYGRTYKNEEPFSTAVVLAGYADGHPRRLSNAAFDVIGGRRYPQVGRICMDMHMLNITGHEEEVHPGDEVTLWGASGMCTEEAAQIVGTINYELTCLITPRVPRVYINEPA
ncbi:MAG: alanine racemase [Clostridia bacterium]|nr:alanine racemase [Clostridia bacterium]